MTVAQFLATLPPALSRHFPDYASDVTIAKTMRAEIALAVDHGVLPAGTLVSVRSVYNRSSTRRLSSARASRWTTYTFTVEIAGWEGAVFADDYATFLLDEAIRPAVPGSLMSWSGGDVGHANHRTDKRLSAALNEALVTIAAIAERHNYDNSDGYNSLLMPRMFQSPAITVDLGYYLEVNVSTLITTATNGIKLEADPAYRALLTAATAAAQAIGPKATRAILGRGGMDGASTWVLEQLIKVASRANGIPVAYDKRRRAWLPVRSPIC